MYSTKSDVYAFSIILWELAHWRQSYSGVAMGEIRDAIKSGDRMPIEEEVPDEIKTLIEIAWDMVNRILILESKS